MRRVKKIGTPLIFLVVVFLGFYSYLHANYYPPILMYHHIDEEMAKKNTIAVSPEVFAKQMAFIKKHNYRVVSLGELCRMIRRGDRLPHNLLAITLDDGYRNNLIAVRTLKKYNFPAIIFMIINLIDKPGYLRKQDLDWIVKDTPVSLGSHTITHRYLPELPIGELRDEIFISRVKARQDYGWDLSILCYPVGGFTPEALRQVKEAGYQCACSTNRGVERKPDIYALRRIKITNRDSGIRLWGKFSGFYTHFKRLRPPY